MTSIVAGGIFNAVAFAGAGFLFSKLNKEGYNEELERRYKAMEKLKEAWAEREVKRKDRMVQLRLDLEDANQEMEETNSALKELNTLQKASSVDQRPTIHNFYEPSHEMRKYQDLMIGVIGLTSGALGAVLIKKYGL